MRNFRRTMLRVGEEPSGWGRIVAFLVAGGVAFLHQAFRRFISPRGDDRASKSGGFGAIKPHLSASLPPPSAFDRREDLRLGVDELALLFWSQFDHAPIPVAREQRRKYLSFDAEIGMPHVRALRGLRHAQGN